MFSLVLSILLAVALINIAIRIGSNPNRNPVTWVDYAVAALLFIGILVVFVDSY